MEKINWGLGTILNGECLTVSSLHFDGCWAKIGIFWIHSSFINSRAAQQIVARGRLPRRVPSSDWRLCRTSEGVDLPVVAPCQPANCVAVVAFPLCGLGAKR